MVVTVFSVSLTWTHVVLVLRVVIVETSISLMELLDCYFLMVVISMGIVELRELTYIVETMLSHQLVSIAVLLMSMMILTVQSMWDCILPVEVRSTITLAHTNVYIFVGGLFMWTSVTTAF